MNLTSKNLKYVSTEVLCSTKYFKEGTVSEKKEGEKQLNFKYF